MISKATQQDVPALNELVNSAYRGDSSRQGWTTEADLLDGTRTDEDAIAKFFFEPGATILKYVEQGKILGCVRLLKHGDQLYLGMLAVDPASQDKGIGKKILIAAESEALNQNCKSIDMTVISERNELISWYKRHGYAEVGEKKPMVFDNPSGGVPKKDLYFITLEKILNSKSN
jgi:ribosomal protein S18 acetylase RimI-like enzyme